MEKKQSIVLFVFELVASFFGTAYLVYHAIYYSQINNGEILRLFNGTFLPCYIVAAGLMLASFIWAIVAFVLHNFQKGPSFSYFVYLALGATSFFFVALFHTFFNGYYNADNYYLMGSVAFCYGLIPLTLALLAACLYKKSPLARAILASVAVILALVIIPLGLTWLAVEDYGEPYSGVGGPLHFVLGIPALLAFIGVYIPGTILTWKEAVKDKRQAKTEEPK